MPDLSSPGPHKVNGQGCGLLHWTISQSCLLCSPENSEGTGVEEGQVPQLTVLVSWQNKWFDITSKKTSSCIIVYLVIYWKQSLQLPFQTESQCL